MKAFLLSSIALIVLPAHAAAQSIDISELGSAAAYEPGTLSFGNGGLSQNLWAGTRSGTAENLIKALPRKFSNPMAKELARAALLSAGVPPEGSTNSSFQQIRFDAIIALSDMAAAQDIAQRTPELAGSRQLKADLALLSGDVGSACALSDSILDARSDPYWMKLRAFCHVERGETAAAELTLDLLRSSGDDDKTFQTLMRQLMAIPGRPDLKGMKVNPLSMAMMDKAALDWPGGHRPAIAAARAAYNPLLSAEEKLRALFVADNALSNTQMAEIIRSFAAAPAIADGLAGGFGDLPAAPNLDAAMAETTPLSLSQLYTLSQTGEPGARIRAMPELLRRAETNGALSRFVKFLEPELRTISYGQIAQSDIAIFTQAAVILGDISALQQIHGLLGENVKAQDRVALAADALGNGFYAGSLGTDIDSRLGETGRVKSRALRDALLAHALGAQLSETALETLQSKNAMGQFSGALFALGSSAQMHAEAETALRAALILDNNSKLSDLQLYQIVSALYKAGLTDYAAKLAAQDFLTGFLE